MMVVEAAVSGRDRPRWWGVMRGGGALAVLGAEGGIKRWGVGACEAAVVASAARPREEDGRAGPACL
jgi:hypothetical protein